MPILPYPISGIVKDSRNFILANLTIFLKNTTKNSNSLPIVTDSNGRYDADAANFNTEYATGDSVSVEANNPFKDEYKIVSFIISGSSKTQNLTLEVIDDVQKGTAGQIIPINVVNVNREPYTKDSPFPMFDKFYYIFFFYTKAFAYKAGTSFVEYTGWAKSGSSKASPVWIIQKITYDGTKATDIQWADGNINENKIWNNKETLDYS